MKLSLAAMLTLTAVRRALRAAAPSALLGAGACLFGGGPLVVRVEEGGAQIEGERFEEMELDAALERAFQDGGVREVILESGPETSADYLASLMDRIHRASRAAGLEGDCNIEARALPDTRPDEPAAEGSPAARN